MQPIVSTKARNGPAHVTQDKNPPELKQYGSIVAVMPGAVRPVEAPVRILKGVMDRTRVSPLLRPLALGLHVGAADELGPELPALLPSLPQVLQKLSAGVLRRKAPFSFKITLPRAGLEGSWGQASNRSCFFALAS